MLEDFIANEFNFNFRIRVPQSQAFIWYVLEVETYVGSPCRNAIRAFLFQAILLPSACALQASSNF